MPSFVVHEYTFRILRQSDCANFEKPFPYPILGAKEALLVDYPEGTAHQPNERALALGRAHLLELQAAPHEMPESLGRRRVRDFTLWPVAAA